MNSIVSAQDASQATEQQPASAPHILVEHHLGLVMHLAKRYAGRYQGQRLLDLDDLYQEGVLGLMHAAKKFDVHKGFQFSTYAAYWIRQAIVRAIMSKSRAIRLPIDIWPASERLAQAQAFFWQQHHHEPSLDVLAEMMQCEKEQVLLLLQLQHEPVSLEQPVSSENEELTLGQTLEASDDTEQREQRQDVAALLTHLSSQERRVIQTRYQLGHTGAYSVEDLPLPYTEVSRQLGMTASLVKAVETRALIKLRFWAERTNGQEGKR